MKKLFVIILAAVYSLMVFAACSVEQNISASQSQSDTPESTISSSSGRPASSSSRSTSGSSSKSTSESQSSSAQPPSQSQRPGSSQPSGSAAALAPSSSQSAQEPAPAAPAPAPDSTPAPAPTPPPAPSSQPQQPKGAYDYPFDVATIQGDMIAWGQAAGMTHESGARSPGDSSWDNPITASQSFQGEVLKNKLREYVQFYTSATWTSYGNEPVTHFTIYVDGTTFYVLH